MNKAIAIVSVSSIIGIAILISGNMFGFVFIAGGFAVFMKMVFANAKARNTVLNAEFKLVEFKYNEALKSLEQSPGDSLIRTTALELGRKYYAYLHPDTHDANGHGISSNFRDNSAAREAKIQSDINARTGGIK